MTVTTSLRSAFAAAMILGAIAGGGATGMAAEHPAARPNILFIMVDDLGKEWISCYGAEDIQTPNIDALAAGGMKFNSAYSMPACSPSRTTLLTGKYPWRTGWVGHWDVPRWGVAYFDWKKKQNTTFARLMKELGYATAAAGKWQINDFRLEPQAMKKHGFDDWAMWTGCESSKDKIHEKKSTQRYWNPYIHTKEGSKTYEGKFGPDIYSDHLINFMREHKEDPMCLYFPLAQPHTPVAATPDEPKVKSVLDKHKAMVRYIDKMLGKLVKELVDLGIRDRTIVIFTTDNGTAPPPRGVTGTRNGKEVVGSKGTETEAGVCAPFIVNCPGLVPAGIETEALTDFSDMLPTFLELGGGKLPQDLIIDGTSIAPLILGKEKDSERKWIMALGYGAARLTENGVRGVKDFATRVIRDKRYKVWVSNEKKIIRLHDLRKDPWEENNLLNSKSPEHQKALKKFQQVIDSLPEKDACPLYEPRAKNPWDKKARRVQKPKQADASRTYELWEPEPAPNRGSNWESTKADDKPSSYDKDWERWSHPLGNGYVGACLFGRTDTERIQITDKTLHNKGRYNKGGLTSFAEVYLDLKHDQAQNYRRSLNLNEAIAHVSYEQAGVNYKREYFASYPDNVIAVRLTADQKGALSFTVRPKIPYLDAKERTGTVNAEDNLLLLKGTIPLFSCNFEGQIKVLNEGGTVTADSEKGVLKVSEADAVTLLITTGSNYRLSTETFRKRGAKKLNPKRLPHEQVTARINAAEALGYAAIKERHLNDYQNLFGRVSLNLNSTPSTDPTHLLLEKYQQGKPDTWLEELMFQYGRYLLIASSRQKTLPANLQGTWSQHYHTPWSGGYWHNINVQMNYWGAMSANLPECFEAYIAFFKAYLPLARQHAADYVRDHNPSQLTEGDNGWIIGTGANAYYIPAAKGGHSGPGTGGFTAKLLVDYYQFTQDQSFLEEVAYPSMLSLSKFYSKALIPHGDVLLVEPSSSPEQIATAEQVEGMPGRWVAKKYYTTAGCTFDQGFVWESFTDTLSLADKLGKKDPFLDTIREQVTKLDPILIGADGQIKEYREENNYSDIGQAKHRHISHLCPLFPGTLINSDHADWMQAASKTLDLRGNKTTGWALAHRMNSRARLGEGEKAHEAYQRFIRERTVQNLWTLHPPFQIDGSLGTMAGVAEMLLQSHGDYIQILPALPAAWNTGHFDGLVARGNFVFSAKWNEGKATAVSILSRSGGECRIACPGIGAVTVIDSAGNTVEVTRDGKDRIRFSSAVGERYAVEP